MSIICEQCGKTFKTTKTLRTHVESVHEKLRKYVCPICDKAFFDRGKLNFHQHKHSEVRNFHCEECGRSFKTKSDLYQHYEIHDKGKTFTCQECGLEIAKRRTYEAHLRTHNDRNPHNNKNTKFCCYCNKEFRHPCDVQRHIASVHEKVINFVCPICKKGFSRKDRFVEHTELHNKNSKLTPKRGFVDVLIGHLESDDDIPVDNGEFPCDSCDKSYGSQKGLTTHKMKVHETLNKFQCEDCPETFFLRVDLNVHQEEAHGKNMKSETLKCDECQEEFSEAGAFYKHYKIIHPEATFKCENCNVEFERRSSYDIHMRRLKDLGRCFKISYNPDINVKDLERVFSCNICEKAYKSPDYLKKHRRLVHEKIRNYVCNLCHAAFMNHSEYKNHVLNRHSKKTSFVCEDCGQGFKIKTELNKHFEIHDKGKTFSCSLCPETFAKRGTFEIHLRRHEIIRDRTCEECNEVFKNMKGIARHLKVIHGEDGYIYICDCCRIRFVRKNSLIDHLSEHFNIVLSKEINDEPNFKYGFKLRDCYVKLERMNDFKVKDLRDEWEEIIVTDPESTYFEQLIINDLKEEPYEVFKEEPVEFFFNEATGLERLQGLDSFGDEDEFPKDIEFVKLEIKDEESDEESIDNEPLIHFFYGEDSNKLAENAIEEPQVFERTTRPSRKIANKNPEIAKKEPMILKIAPKRPSAVKPGIFEKDFINKPIICEICDLTFKKVPALRNHIYRYHNPSHVPRKQEKKFACPTCKQLYYSKQSLDEHYRAIHEKARDFICAVCNLDFAWKNSLDRHKCPGYKMKDIVPLKPVVPIEIFDNDSNTEDENIKENEEIKSEGEECVEIKIEKSSSEEREPIEKTIRNPRKAKLSKIISDKKHHISHHIEIPDKDKTNPFCEICQIDFVCIGSFKQHNYRKHPINGKHLDKEVCDVCQLKFNSKDALRNHKRRKHNARQLLTEKSQCPICELWFNSKESMGMHRYRKHSDNPPPQKTYNKSNNTCEFCGNTYHSKQNLVAHQRAIHLGFKDFTCTICDLKFAWEKSFKSHNAVHHKVRHINQYEQDEENALIQHDNSNEIKEYNCKSCSKKFITARHLARHDVLVHEKLHLIFCCYCSSTFKSRDELKSHSIETHSKECVFDCVFCEHSFTNKESCDQHEVDIHDLIIRNYDCDLCSKSYTLKNNLAKHRLAVHFRKSKEDTLKCTICKEKFDHYTSRRKHMKMVHQGGTKLTRDCGVCLKEFTLAQDFLDHITAHEGCVICEICGVDFENEHALKFHKTVHRKVNSEEKKISCDTCGMKFLKKANLLVHMSLHSNEYKFVCDECGKSFKYQSNLCTHKQAHKKAFKCHYCEKSFGTNQFLSVHERTHTGFKPYDCDQCDAKFASVGALNCHKVKHSGDKNFKCHKCSASFGYNISLKSHLLKKHSIVLERKRGKPSKASMQPITEDDFVQL